MSRISTIKTIATTLSVAFGVGFIMQYGEGDATPSATTDVKVESQAVRTLMMSTNALGESVFGVPDVVTTPLAHFENVRTVSSVDVIYSEFAVPQMGTILSTPIAGCDTNITAFAEEAATVSLAITAPCEANADFVLRHGIVSFTGRTDEVGNASFIVPALTVDATFAVLFGNVEQARTTLVVPDVRLYDRAVLQWRGAYNLQLHALEAGASIGDPGHVWSASVQTATQAISGEQGFVLRLGTTDVETPQLVEVYTYPAGRDSGGPMTSLQIGVSVTDANCGREIDAMTIQTKADQSIVVNAIAAALPDCGSIGELAMLRDVFGDMTLASR